MPDGKLILDYVYAHEASHRDEVLLTQPLGSGKAVDYTWGRALDEARRMANHLQRMGLRRGDHVAILSKNCAHFVIAELAIWIAGCTTVAIFPNERSSTVNFVLEHSDAKLLFVGKLDNWDKQHLPQNVRCIALPLAPDTAVGEHWDDIISRTPALAGRPARAADDLAMLIYTSGSTGLPKGVMHAFGRITRAVEGIIRTILRPFDADEELRMFSYLPLAHVYERSGLQCLALIRGKTRIYFAESVNTFVADLKRARPSVFYSVPRLWLKFQRAVFAKIGPAKLDFLLTIPILRKVVARQILARLGLKHVRLAGSASAPISADLIAWYRRLGLNLLEGYGMTEDFGYSHASSSEHNAQGYVGVPFPGVDVRFGERGEILIRSPGQCVGYYKRPDLDAESFTADGFFRTGDVGKRRANGLLKVTGRVKEIFKTSGGEYVAPAPIENLLNEHPMVELSMVSGLGREAPYGMIVVAEEFRASVDDPRQRAAIETELTQLLNKLNQTLLSSERLHMLVALTEPWTVENGCLTPTLKLKRKQIEALADPSLDAWYSTGARVIWGQLFVSSDMSRRSNEESTCES
jgi:long-subunit acyl-CoA synthetase (AMP-forming)